MTQPENSEFQHLVTCGSEFTGESHLLWGTTASRLLFLNVQCGVYVQKTARTDVCVGDSRGDVTRGQGICLLSKCRQATKLA